MNASLFSNQTIIDSVKKYISSMQKQTLDHTNVVIDGHVARGIALVDLLLADMVNAVAPKPHEVLLQCAKSISSMPKEHLAMRNK